MTNFRTAIVDELGCVVTWCEGITEKEKEEMLENHSEWKIECICID